VEYNRIEFAHPNHAKLVRKISFFNYTYIKKVLEWITQSVFFIILAG
jgi:hypothetical protein